MTTEIDRNIVLTHLVVLRHVRIEVVLPMEDRVLHRAVERGAQPDGELDDLTVEHRERPGQAEAHRAHVGVRLVAEVVRAATEDLRLRLQLGMAFEPDDELVAVQVRAHLALRSSSAATWNMTGSPIAGASTCTPTGRPSAPVPKGTLMPGWPARFVGIV